MRSPCRPRPLLAGQVEAAGKLQVRLVSFSNPESRALGGACCQPTARAEQSSCSGECSTFFRVCASTGSGGGDSAAAKSEHSAGTSSNGEVTVKSASLQIVQQATPFSVVSPPARDAIQNRQGELTPTEDVSLSPASELSEQENGFISPHRPIIILDNPGSTDDVEALADETQLSSRMTVSHESKYDSNPQDIGFHFFEHGDLVQLQFATGRRSDKASFHPSPPGAGSGGSSTGTGASVDVDSVGGGGEAGKKEHGSGEGTCCNERQKRETHDVTLDAEDDAVSADADAEVLPQSGETAQPKKHGDQPDTDDKHSEDTAGWTLSSPSWEFIGPETSTDLPSSPDDTTEPGPLEVTAPPVRPAAPPVRPAATPVTPAAPPVRPAARRDPPSSRLGPARRGAPERRWRRPQLPCSLGLLVTGVVANSSLVNQHNRVLEMTFPFDGAWPGELDLTIEAWHDTTGKLFSERPTATDKPVARPRIISRTVVRRPLAPAPGWSRDRVRQGHVQLEYDVRLVCDPDPASRGADCMTEGTV
ncbi:uncharacterized protein LOC122393885 [Amphibalanus amphitrite]|uniref:uncharacterized protein LOC122393885 n=1 Tax=Amphibalanus amphitrite TaxID=1232801 RepID=UPI001C90E211|nr:uncharacterized protein LOC122393885 [Amphibalanus amphitrite]